MNNYPEFIKQKLRGRLGYDIHDQTQDERVNIISPQRAFRMCVAWELGDFRWADDFILWINECGGTVTWPEKTSPKWAEGK